MTRYETPSRPQSATWQRARTWWKSLPTPRRVTLLHRHGPAMAGLVAYYRRGGR